MIELALPVTQALIRRFEGLYLTPYLCPAGVPTIGYGATRYLDGRPVRLTDPAITEIEAEVMLKEQVIREYLPAVLKLCPNISDPNQLAAIIDFTFNLGSNRLKNSTLRKRINAGDWDGARKELAKWVYGGGRRLRGLVLRRAAEIALT